MSKTIKGRNGGTLKPNSNGGVPNPNGRPIGSRNRATVAKWVLNLKGIFPDKVFEELRKIYPEIEKQMSIEEIAMIMQANRAIQKSDTKAIEFLINSAYPPHKQNPESSMIFGETQILITNKPD
jgi:hypothetical protein